MEGLLVVVVVSALLLGSDGSMIVELVGSRASMLVDPNVNTGWLAFCVVFAELVLFWFVAVALGNSISTTCHRPFWYLVVLADDEGLVTTAPLTTCAKLSPFPPVADPLSRFVSVAPFKIPLELGGCCPSPGSMLTGRALSVLMMRKRPS